MWKWLGRLIAVAILVLFGLTARDFYRGGYFDLPDLRPNEYPISFRNGFRAILTDPIVSNPSASVNSKFFRRLRIANPDRIYLGFPYEVPSWFEDAWSHCDERHEGQEEAILDAMPVEMRRNLIGARFEGVCAINSDGEIILRGVIFSVPEK